jgi:hypothetical protein
MFLAGLSLAEFLALFTLAGSVVVALYLLDRSRRRLIVSTLRFWSQARHPVESTRRRRIRQWPSLLMQLAALVCLLLAIAQLRWGSREDNSRDHVLILDTSAWMGARAEAAPGGATLLDRARAQALAYLRVVPAGDRVMLLAADALATPLTSFETDRRKLEQALARAEPAATALNLRQAFEYARQLQRRNARRAGEIVFAGAGRVTEGENPAPPANLRLLSVSPALDNVGLRKIGLRLSATESDLWDVFVSVRNHGARDQTVDLGLQFGGAPSGSRRFRLASGAEQEISFQLRTRAAGLLEARLRSGGNSLAMDDRAVLELPSLEPLQVTICSDQPASLRPLLEAHPNVRAAYVSLSRCDTAPPARIMVYDGGVPAPPTRSHAIYIQPPADRSPARVLSTASGAVLTRWISDHPLTAGLRRQDLPLASAEIFAAGPGDVAVAETQNGPVLLARSSSQSGEGKSVFFGFHPARGPLRYELSIPLLFANVLRWMEPDHFRRWELFAAGVGNVRVPLQGDHDPARLRVIAQDGSSLPFSVRDGSLHFFSPSSGAVRVQAGDQELVHSLVLPEIPDSVWEPPAGVRKGIPRPREATAASRDLWAWLAAAGAVLLWLEWMWFAPVGDRPAGSRWPRLPIRLPGRRFQAPQRRAS